MEKKPKKSICVPIECIFNEKLRKGLCVGVSHDTRSYSKDVIRLCWVRKKSIQGVDCAVNMQAQMTPAEAVGIGVALIRSSIVGESMLKTQEMEARQRQKESQ